MAFASLFLKDLAELKTRRGNASDTAFATIFGLNYPTDDSFTIYTWANLSEEAGNDDSIVHPTVGATFSGRWYRRKYRSPFEDITNKPTTIAGYGITDFNSLGDARWLQTSNFNTLGDARYSLLSHTHSFAQILDKPTTISGYGITDFNSLGDARWLQTANFNSLVDSRYLQISNFNSVGDARYSLLSHTHSFAQIVSKPTTISGYGITDYNSLGDARWVQTSNFNTLGDARYSLLSHTHSFSQIVAKPTTLSGYGITDGYSNTNPSNFISLTNLSAGTGISYNNTSGVITNSAPDQTVTLTGANNLTISGTYPNFTITQYIPSVATASRTLNSNYTISTTKQATVSYTVTCSVTNPLLAGNSTANAFLEYSTNGGSTWISVAQNGNVSSVGVAVAVAITNSQTLNLSGVIPANALVRLRTSTSGIATVTYVMGQEVY